MNPFQFFALAWFGSIAGALVWERIARHLGLSPKVYVVGLAALVMVVLGSLSLVRFLQ